LKEEINSTEKKNVKANQKGNNKEHLTITIPEDLPNQQNSRSNSSEEGDEDSANMENGKLPQFSPTNSNQTLEKEIEVLREK
jgi:hypothetical protein